MCCPSNKVIRSDSKSFSSYRRVTRRQVMRNFITKVTDQCQNGSYNLLTPYREQPRSTRIVVAYPRPAFSATKRTNLTPISLDQQAQVSQGHTLCRMKEYRNTEVHGGRSLELVNPARELASSRPKVLCIPEKYLRNLARSPLLVGPRRKKTDRGQRSAFPSETSRFAPLVLAHKGSALYWLVDDRAPFPPRRIWCLLAR